MDRSWLRDWYPGERPLGSPSHESRCPNRRGNDAGQAAAVRASSLSLSQPLHARRTVRGTARVPLA